MAVGAHRCKLAQRTSEDTIPGRRPRRGQIASRPAGRAATPATRRSKTGSSDSTTRPSAPKTRKRSKRPGEPAVVGHREHRAVEGLQRLLQRLGRQHVEVVGRLVQQQQGRAGQLQQQDLEPGLLAAGQRPEVLVALLVQLVAAQRAPSPPVTPMRAPVAWSSVVSAVPEQVDQRAVEPLRVGVGLGEQARHHPGAEPPAARCARPSSPPSSRRKCDLPAPLEPSTADPLAVEDLGRERLHQPGQLQLARRSPPACRSGRRAAAS